MKIKKLILPIFILLSVLRIYGQKKITIDEVNEIVLTKSDKIKIINNNILKSKSKADFYRISLLMRINS